MSKTEVESLVCVIDANQMESIRRALLSALAVVEDGMGRERSVQTREQRRRDAKEHTQ